MNCFIKVFASFCLGAAAFASALEPLKIGVTYPSADIIEPIREDLAAAGYDLQIVEFNDYLLPNQALAAGELDLNQFQTIAYLEDFNAQKGTQLVPVANVFLVPMGVYSARHKDILALPEGGVIYVPNDPSNETRALDVLAAAGLIELDNSSEQRTVLDIIKNPRKLKIYELDAAQLPRVLDEADACVINTNYALSAGLDPLRDAIYREGRNPLYNNVVVTRPEDAASAKTLAYVKAFQSEKTVRAMQKVFKGSIIPVFEPIQDTLRALGR